MKGEDMWEPIVKFFVGYLEKKPIGDVLLIVFIGVFLWMESGHGERTNKAHQTLHTILQERDANEQRRTEANERNTDKIIAALTGVEKEVKKNTAVAKTNVEATQAIPEAAAVAAKVLVEKAAESKGE